MKKKALLMALLFSSFTLSGCSALVEMSKNAQQMTNQKGSNGLNNAALPIGIGHFAPGKMTEGEFLSLLQKQGFAIKECDNAFCAYAQGDKQEVVKFVKNKEKASKSAFEYKYGPNTVTYGLMNYPIDGKNKANTSIAAFHKGVLTTLTIGSPDPKLVSDFKNKYPNFKERTRDSNPQCVLKDGTKTRKPASRIVTNWEMNNYENNIEMHSGDNLLGNCNYKKFTYIMLLNSKNVLSMEKDNLKYRF